MKSKFNSPLFRTASLACSVFLIAYSAAPCANAAALTWDTVTGDGAIITDGGGTWTSGAANWNNAVTDVPWSQTSGTNGTNSATFGGGIDGTYAIAVGGPSAPSELHLTILATHLLPTAPP